MEFSDTNGSPNFGQTTRPCNNEQRKKRTRKFVDITVPDDHRVKSKESEKKDQYMYLVIELKNCGT